MSTRLGVGFWGRVGGKGRQGVPGLRRPKTTFTILSVHGLSWRSNSSKPGVYIASLPYGPKESREHLVIGWRPAAVHPTDHLKLHADDGPSCALVPSKLGPPLPLLCAIPDDCMSDVHTAGSRPPVASRIRLNCCRVSILPARRPTCARLAVGASTPRAPLFPPLPRVSGKGALTVHSGIRRVCPAARTAHHALLVGGESEGLRNPRTQPVRLLPLSAPTWSHAGT